MTDESEIKVGSTVWVFNGNHRVYRRDETGHAIGGPIYREHFRPYEIESETSRSWVLARSGLKVPKQGGDVRECGGGPYGKTRVYMTAEAVEANCWRRVHAGRISELVGRCGDVETLRKVAELIGYEAKP